MDTRPALLGANGAALGRKLTAAHLAITAVMVLWLILRTASWKAGGQGPPLDWLIAVNVLKVMHLPYTAVDESGLFSTLSWKVFVPLAAVLILVGSVWWGFFMAWLVKTSQSVFRS